MAVRFNVSAVALGRSTADNKLRSEPSFPQRTRVVPLIEQGLHILRELQAPGVHCCEDFVRGASPAIIQRDSAQALPNRVSPLVTL